MAHPVTIERFHEESLRLYEYSPRITYSKTGNTEPPELDCRAVILAAVRRAGYKAFRFSTTNDFWDNFCKWRGTPEEAKKLGYWRRGLILFNLNEATGKTTHMGVLTDRRKTLYPDIEGRTSGNVINSSEQKNGMILSDTETNGGWYNRCALALDSIINYSSWFGGTSNTDDPETASAVQGQLKVGQACVISSSLRLREQPSTAKGVKVNHDMKKGDILAVERFLTGEDGDPWVWGWIQKQYRHEGYAKISDSSQTYLEIGGSASEEANDSNECDCNCHKG